MPSKNYPKDIFEQIDIELCATEYNIDALQRLKGGYFPTYDETNLPNDLVNGQAFMTQQGHFCVYVEGTIYCMPGEDTPPPPLPVWYRQWLLASSQASPGTAPFISGNEDFYPNIANIEIIPIPSETFGPDYRKWKRDYTETYCLKAFTLFTNDMTDPLMPIHILRDDLTGNIGPVSQLENGTYVASGSEYTGMVSPAPAGPGNPNSVIGQSLIFYDDVVAGSSTTIDTMLVSGTPDGGPYTNVDFSYGFLIGTVWTYDGRFVYSKARYQSEDGAYGPEPIFGQFGDAYLSDGSTIDVAGGRVYIGNSAFTIVTEEPTGTSTPVSDLIYWSRFSPTTGELIYRSWTLDATGPHAGDFDITSYALNSTIHGVLATSGSFGFDENSISSFFEISPDGTMIAYTTIGTDQGSGKLWLMNIDGTDKRELFGFGIYFEPVFGPVSWGVAWNREGDTVGVIGGFRTAYIINIETGRFETIAMPTLGGNTSYGPIYSSWHWRP